MLEIINREINYVYELFCAIQSSGLKNKAIVINLSNIFFVALKRFWIQFWAIQDIQVSAFRLKKKPHNIYTVVAKIR